MKKVLLVLCAISLTCCASAYVGYRVPPNIDVGWIKEDAGHHILKYEHLNLDYDYQLDRVQNTLSCDGFIDYRQDQISGGFQVVDMLFDVFFVDQYRTILDFKQFRVSGHQTTKRNPFERTFELPVGCAGIAFSYSGAVD